MKNQLREAALFAAMTCAPFFAILVCLLFLACAPAEPEAPPAYIGTWAGNLTVPNSAPFLVTLEIRMDGTFQDSIASGGNTLFKESGTWKVSGNQFIQTPDQCQEADPPGKLLLVACSGPDSTRIVIDKGEWIQSGIIAGAVYSVAFRRVD